MERIIEALRARFAPAGEGNPIPAGTPGRA
jgi:hypothetical protein